MVVFDHDLSILNVSSTTDIDLRNDYVVFYLNKTSLLQQADNTPLSASKGHYFVIAAYNVLYRYIDKQHIHSGHQAIIMKFYKALSDMALIYVNIWSYT